MGRGFIRERGVELVQRGGGVDGRRKGRRRLRCRRRRRRRRRRRPRGSKESEASSGGRSMASDPPRRCLCCLRARPRASRSFWRIFSTISNAERGPRATLSRPFAGIRLEARRRRCCLFFPLVFFFSRGLFARFAPLSLLSPPPPRFSETRRAPALRYLPVLFRLASSPFTSAKSDCAGRISEEKRERETKKMLAAFFFLFSFSLVFKTLPRPSVAPALVA